MSFWKKETKNPDENTINARNYAECLRRFVELSADVSILNTKLKNMELALDNLRGRFSAKLKGIKEALPDTYGPEDVKKEEPQQINTSNDVPFG